MQIHRDTSDSINIIRALGADGVHVGQKLLTLPCVIAVATIIERWAVSSVAALSPDQLQPVIDLDPELIILGSGSSIEFPLPSINKFIHQRNIGFEVMDTAAGCRTYNLLAHEGRNVALALLPMQAAAGQR